MKKFLQISLAAFIVAGVTFSFLPSSYAHHGGGHYGHGCYYDGYRR